VENQYFVLLIGKVAVFVCTAGSLQHSNHGNGNTHFMKPLYLSAL